MAILIDSTVFIDYERGKLDFGAWCASLPGERFAMSVVSLVELYHGMYRANSLVRFEKRQRFILQRRQDCPVLPINDQMAELAGKLRAELQIKGVLIAPHDLRIAASALAGGHSVATANLRDFTRVPGLQVLQWQGSPPAQTEMST